ncbi:PE family protein [Mycobacterium riyadhense]|uniref:PE family protein n=1 Tax=Mycobacterium riyadhense TaxID=486698 RepID=A0A1X2BIM5_9MYCO|nr:PE-PPE domain-containing protein [Mycobacterium riyadhense]MCV7146764.1 PE-PPE domain-containing protein [Mycobacterium riyadhense]ORW63458.1 hypothetical protein AWC22_03385 [Mycobacterium riyadhense]
MASVIASPEVVAGAAADLSALGSTISRASEAAAGVTTAVGSAAADEVSVAIAELFSQHARDYQVLAARAAEFHDEFAQLLAAAGNAYGEAEAAASDALGTLTSQARALLVPVVGNAETGAAGAAATPVAVSLIMGASGVPTPSPSYVSNAYNKYIAPYFTASNLQVLSTPEGLYPITGIKDLTLNISVARGLQILDGAIHEEIAKGNTPINVFGYSQAAILGALELPKLQAEGVPTSDVNFVFVGNEMTPNGGMLARFPGLSLPSLGITFYGGMDANTGYTVENYTLEYDGFADFPQYPINILADLNAFAGIAFVHTTYLEIPQSQIDSAVVLPTSPGYSGGTTYYMIPTKNLPLLEPVRWIPWIGNPLADLVQPNLRYLVNWGYGDINYGYSTGPADVTTPFGFLPPLSTTMALGPALVSGTQQGIFDASNTLYAQGPPTLPNLPLLDISQPLTSGSTLLTSSSSTSIQSAITDLLMKLQTGNSNIVNDLTNDFSTTYATLLPTADIATAVLVTLPAYDVNLFLSGIIQMVNGQPLEGLVNAIGLPIAATIGGGTLAVAVEFLVLLAAAQTILTGAQHPSPV